MAFGVLKKVAKAFAGWLARWPKARSCVSVMMGGWSNARSLCQHHDGWLARWPNARSLSASWQQCGSVNSDGSQQSRKDECTIPLVQCVVCYFTTAPWSDLCHTGHSYLSQ